MTRELLLLRDVRKEAQQDQLTPVEWRFALCRGGVSRGCVECEVRCTWGRRLGVIGECRKESTGL